MTSPSETTQTSLVQEVPEVTEGFLDVVFPTRGLVREDAAIQLDSEMRRLAMGRNVLDLAIGRQLQTLVHGNRIAECGAVRLLDYAVEVLGVSQTTLRNLARRDKELQTRDILRAALMDGRILATQVDLILRRVKDPQQDSLWVEEARRRTVRGLAQALVQDLPEEHRSSARAESADAEGQAPAGQGGVRTFQLTGPVYADYVAHRELASRVSGTDVSDSEALEALAAEFLSGLPLSQAGEAGRDGASVAEGWTAGGPGLDPDPVDGQQSGGASVPASESAADDRPAPPDRQAEKAERARQREDLRRILEEITDQWVYLSRTPVVVEISSELAQPESAEGHAWHRHLQHLFRVRSRLSLYIGRMLRNFKDCRLHRDCQFVDIYHYASERLGLGRSTVADMVARDQKLIHHPLVFDAIHRGDLTPGMADQVLACIGDTDYTRAWIDYARRHTVRHMKGLARLRRMHKDIFSFCNGPREQPPAPGRTVAEVYRDFELEMEQIRQESFQDWALGVGQTMRHVLKVSTLACLHGEIHLRLRELATARLAAERQRWEAQSDDPPPEGNWTDDEIDAVLQMVHDRLNAGTWPPRLDEGPSVIQDYLQDYRRRRDGEQAPEPVDGQGPGALQTSAREACQDCDSVQTFALDFCTRSCLPPAPLGSTGDPFANVRPFADPEGGGTDQGYDGEDDLAAHIRQTGLGRYDTSDLEGPRPSRFSPQDLVARVSLRVFLEAGVEEVLDAGFSAVRAQHGQDLDESSCLGLMIEHFRNTWTQAQRQTAADRRRFFERAGYRCAVPGCTSRRNLQIDHVQPRARGGSDDPENLCCLCEAHHLRHKHGERMCVSGRAPQDLVFQVGVVNRIPWAVYRGDCLMSPVPA